MIFWHQLKVIKGIFNLSWKYLVAAHEVHVFNCSFSSFLSGSASFEPPIPDRVGGDVYRLYIPQNDQLKNPDIVFIHGIGGDGYSTWHITLLISTICKVPFVAMLLPPYLKGCQLFLAKLFPTAASLQFNTIHPSLEIGCSWRIPCQSNPEQRIYWIPANWNRWEPAVSMRYALEQRLDPNHVDILVRATLQLLECSSTKPVPRDLLMQFSGDVPKVFY